MAWPTFGMCSSNFSTKKLRSATIESHSSAIKFFHRISRGFEIDTTHPVIANALKGAARLHADVGNQATVRRHVSWDMLLTGEKLIPTWRAGGRVLWLALCASFCLLMARQKCLRKPGYDFTRPIVCGVLMLPSFAENIQLTVAQWSTADRVEVRFRGSKSDPLRKGAVITRVRKGSVDARGGRWRRRRSNDRIDVLLLVSSLFGPLGSLLRW